MKTFPLFGVFLSLHLLFLSSDGFRTKKSFSYTLGSRAHDRVNDKRVSQINFKKKGEGDGGGSGDDGEKGGWWKIWKFLPGVNKAKLEKSYETTETEIGNRYMVRLVSPQLKNRRHIITRLIRYLPDLQFETAGEIVDVAVDNGVSLIRVFNSLKDTEFLCDMLRKADPPIRVEVFDSKKGEILNI